MSLEKVPFLITGLITAYVVQTPPQAAVPTEQRDKEVGTLDNILAKTVPYNVPAIKVASCLELSVELPY